MDRLVDVDSMMMAPPSKADCGSPLNLPDFDAEEAEKKKSSPNVTKGGRTRFVRKKASPPRGAKFEVSQTALSDATEMNGDQSTVLLLKSINEISTR